MPSFGMRSKAVSTSAAAISHSYNLPPDRQRGDLLIVTLATSIPVDLSAPAGFRTIASVGRKLHVFVRRCGGNEATIQRLTASASCAVIASSFAYYGVQTLSDIPYAYTDSPVIRQDTPMATTSNAVADGLLFYTALGEARSSWGTWTSGVVERLDRAHPNADLTLAVAEYAAPATGDSPLVTARIATAARSYTLTLMVPATGIETRLLGDVTAGAVDVASNTLTTTVADQSWLGATFAGINQNSWVYRLGWDGAYTTTGEIVAGAYAATGSVPSTLLGFTERGFYLAESAVELASTTFSLNQTIEVTSTSLNLRQAPGTSQPVLIMLAAGARGTVIGGPRAADGYTWWQLNIQDRTGWAAEPFLQAVVTALTTGDTVEVTSAVNFRTGPSLTSPVQTVLQPGVQLEVIGGPQTAAGYTWWQVRGAAGSGWVVQDFIKKITSNSQTVADPYLGLGATIAFDASGVAVAGVPLARNAPLGIAIANRGSSFRIKREAGTRPLYGGSAAGGTLPLANGALTPLADTGVPALWAWADLNVPPVAPVIIGPDAVTAERSLTPLFRGQFRDPNGRYGDDSGMGVDHGDRLGTYQLELRYAAVDLAPVTNSTFDTDVGGWTNAGVIRAASPYSAVSGVTRSFTRDTEIVKDGSGSLKADVLTNTSATADIGLVYQHATDFSVTGGASYVIRWDGYTRSSSVQPTVRIIWYDNAMTMIGAPIIATLASNPLLTWTSHSLSAIAPAAAVKLRLQLFTRITNSISAGSCNYDNVRIERPLLQSSGTVTASASEQATGEFAYRFANALANNREYQWRARTADYFGTWGAWSGWTNFWVTQTGPLTALYPNEADLFGSSTPGFYQTVDQPTFIYQWESGDNRPLYKFDFEIGSYPDFRPDDPYLQQVSGQSYLVEVEQRTLIGALNVGATTVALSGASLPGLPANMEYVLAIGGEWLQVTALNPDATPFECTVTRGYLASTAANYANGATVTVYTLALRAATTATQTVPHLLPFDSLRANGQRLTPLQTNRKYYWRIRGYDTNNVPSLWSQGMVNAETPEIRNTPALYPVDTDELARLRSTSHRVRAYFCIWDTWKFLANYPKLTWIKGSDTRDPALYTAELAASGTAPYELRFPSAQMTTSEEVNQAIQQNAFAVLGERGVDDYPCVVNLGPNRLAFVGESLAFSADRSWRRGYNVGQGWNATQFSWTFEGATPATATGVGPHQPTWSQPGLYTVTCRYGSEDPVERKVRVYQDRETTAYDVTEIGSISGGTNGWSTSITIKPQLGNLVDRNLNEIMEYQAVGVFVEEEWEVDGVWVRQPVSGYTPDPTCLVTGYIQNGSIKIDANTNTFSFAINPVSEQLKLVTMYGTQTWSADYYRNVALVATPELIPQGTTIVHQPMHIVDVMLLLLQEWTNVLTRHDFIAWYDTSLQARDTVSTNEGPLWNGLSSLADAEYAWLYTDQGSGIRFEPNPSLRSWGAFGDLHPVPYVMDSRDLWTIDVQQKLMNIVNYCQVTGTRPYYPNQVFEGKYPSTIPEGVLGQWLVKTGQLFSAQWFADYMAENMYWDANRKITATLATGANRRIDVPGRLFLQLEIPERNLYFDAKEFYVTGASYTLAPAEGKLTTTFQLIENMYKSSGVTGIRKILLADAVIDGAEALLEASALVVRSDGQTIRVTSLAANLTAAATTLTLASATDITPGILLKIGSELLLVTAVAGVTITVVRGRLGTTAASASTGATVTALVYFKDAFLALPATGFVGGTEIRLVATGEVRSRNTRECVGNGFVVIGPPEIYATAHVQAPDSKREVSAIADVRAIYQPEVTATYVLIWVRTNSIRADGVVS